jgi:hypothetical protein
MPLSGCVSPRRHALERTTMEMNIFAQVTMNEFSPTLKVATGIGGRHCPVRRHKN